MAFTMMLGQTKAFVASALATLGGRVPSERQELCDEILERVSPQEKPHHPEKEMVFSPNTTTVRDHCSALWDSVPVEEDEDWEDVSDSDPSESETSEQMREAHLASPLLLWDERGRPLLVYGLKSYFIRKELLAGRFKKKRIPPKSYGSHPRAPVVLEVRLFNRVWEVYAFQK